MAEIILPPLMFLTLLGLMLTGYSIGIILGGVAILFGFIGMAFDLFRMVEFFNLVPRVWFFAENLQLVAVPLLILMGVMLERSAVGAGPAVGAWAVAAWNSRRNRAVCYDHERAVCGDYRGGRRLSNRHDADCLAADAACWL